MAMRGQQRSSLAWAVESTEGSLDANGVVDVSALTYANAEVMRFDAYESQEEPSVSASDVAKGTPGELHDELITTYTGGVADQHRTGTMAVRPKYLRCAPGGATLQSSFIGAALRTALGLRTRTAGDQDLTAVAVHTVNAIEVATPAEFAVGQMIAMTIARRVEYAWVTGITGNVLTVSPGFSAAPGAGGGDIVRHVATYYPVHGDLAFADHPSLSLRFDTDAKRCLATGCRLTRFEVEVDENRAARVTALDFLLPHIQDDDGSAAPGNPAAQGPPAQRGQSHDVYASTFAVSKPANATRAAMVCKRWKFSVNVDMEPRTISSSKIGHSGMHVVSSKASITHTIEPVSAFDSARREKIFFQMLHGLGPTSVGADGATMGWAFGIKAGKLSGWAKPVVGERVTTQELTWIEGDYDLDTGTWANGIVNAPWTFGAVA